MAAAGSCILSCCATVAIRINFRGGRCHRVQCISSFALCPSLIESRDTFARNHRCHGIRPSSSISTFADDSGDTKDIGRVSFHPLASTDVSIDRAKKLTQTIIATPPGKLEASSVGAVESCLEGWSRLALARNKPHVAAQGDSSEPGNSALRLLNRIKIEEETIGRMLLTGKMFEYAINALSVSGRDGSAHQAGNLLEEYLNLYLALPEMEVRRGKHTYTIRRRKEQRHSFSPPNTIVWSSVMNALAKDNSDPMNAQKAEDFLRKMLRTCLETNEKNDRVKMAIAPNVQSFSAVINGWSLRGEAERAEAVLDWMEEIEFKKERGDSGYRAFSVRPNEHIFNTCISAWSRSKPPRNNPESSARNAERVLKRMDDSCHVSPNVFSFATVLSAWAACPLQPTGARRAEEILSRMEREAGLSGSASKGMRYFLPNTVCYNTVLLGYANAGDPEATERILHHMITLHSEGKFGDRTAKPEIASFNTCLRAWAKSRKSGAAARALALLREMETLASSNAQKSVICPDVVSYNTVLDCLARSSAAEKAEELLLRMESFYKSKGRNDEYTVAVKPDLISYNTVLSGFSRCGSRNKPRRQHNSLHADEGGLGNRVEPAERAESLLRRMKATKVNPDVVSYNACITAWSRSGLGERASERAEAILREMEESSRRGSPEGGAVLPDAISYSAVIDAHARSGAPDAGQKAETVLQRMESRSMEANIFTYNSLMNAWAKSGAPGAAKRAESILIRLEQSRDGRKGSTISRLPRPNLISYCTVLNAWAHSRDKEKAMSSKHVLGRMMNLVERQYCAKEEKWSRQSLSKQASEQVRDAHNMVLGACAYTPSDAPPEIRLDAFRIAEETYKDAHRSLLFRPNQFTYTTFLLVCHHLMGRNESQRKEELIRQVFRDGVASECVTPVVLKQLRKAASPELFQELSQGLGGGI
mmetsp:Transcript_37281/g.111665  ORF Transcript_37281/g.111665 Transcript_37281/m.111665 type:complete len:934 (-) Transcript_37281:182-2983(-)